MALFTYVGNVFDLCGSTSENNQPKLAIEMVDKVRARVGLKGLIESNQDKNLLSDSNALMEEILRERACELGLEDVRFFDMIRNKRADLLSVLTWFAY